MLAVDLFPSQLKDRDLKAQVVKILDESGFPAQRLEIEITESALVADLEGAQHVLGGLREAGVRIALDNFGTGYSSLYHLRNIKLDKIKIDKSFIESMNSRESAAIVNALIGLGEGFGLTIAKIDKSFIESMNSRESAAIVNALIGLGEGFGLTIAAEGIDNPQHQAPLVR